MASGGVARPIEHGKISVWLVGRPLAAIPARLERAKGLAVPTAAALNHVVRSPVQGATVRSTFFYGQKQKIEIALKDRAQSVKINGRLKVVVVIEAGTDK